MKRLNILLLFITSILFHNAYGQTSMPITKIEMRSSIKKLTDGISKDNILKSSSVGYEGVKTDQWKRFAKLKKVATDNELILLTEHSNSVVRCYSFQALATRKNIDVFPILLKHLNDTARVNTFQGCIISMQMTGDYFLDVVTPDYVDLDAYKLKTGQRAIVDSILLFDKSIYISAKYNLLSQIKPNQSYYNRILEIAKKENNPIAIIALARFQNQSNLAFIKTFFDNENSEYEATSCAIVFPDSSFFPNLQNLFEKQWAKKQYDYSLWRILYQALAKYPRPETFMMFKRTSESTDSFRYQTLGTYLIIAITKYPNQLFEPLRNKIKLDDYHLEEVKQRLDYKE